MNYSLINVGIGYTPDNWLRWVNYQSYVDRIYYILDDGAGYLINGEKYYFQKDCIYILPGKLNLTHFIDDRKFKHIYLNFFTGNSYLNHDKVIEILPGELPLIRHSLEHLSLYFRENNLSSVSTTTNSQLFYEHKPRILMITDMLLHDIKNAYDINRLDPQVEKSIAYIKSNYINRISVDDLAKLCNLSPSYFMSIFKKNIGISPHRYIKNFRLNIALNMLRTGESINRIAELCGFLSVSAFSSSFKKAYGVTPSNFTKLNIK